MNNALEQKYKEAQKRYEDAKKEYDNMRFQDAANGLAKQLRQLANVLETDPRQIFWRLPIYTDRIRIALVNIDNQYEIIREIEQEA